MRIYKGPPARDLYLSEQLSERVEENVTFWILPRISPSQQIPFHHFFGMQRSPPKRRSWYRLPVVQHFLFNPAAPWKGSHSQSHEVKLHIPHQVPNQIHHSYMELYHYPREGPLCREYHGLCVFFVLSPARQVPSSRV